MKTIPYLLMGLGVALMLLSPLLAIFLPGKSADVAVAFLFSFYGGATLFISGYRIWYLISQPAGREKAAA